MPSSLLLVRASRAAITRAFPLLAELQPVRWDPDGLIVMPAAAQEAARVIDARSRCPLPLLPLADTTIGIWPDPPARWVAGIYRRSPAHVAAPCGIPEIVQTAGEAFGPGDHETTMMCLEKLHRLPPGDALDVGCGSGLLGLSWARLGKGRVHAIDVDPRAVRQTLASAAHSGLSAQLTVECARVDARTIDRVDATMILANVPAVVHLSLVTALARRVPRAALISGLRAGESGPVLAAYARLGLRRSGAARRGRWECHVLVADRQAR